MPTRRTDIEKRIVNGALSLAAEQGWNATTLAQIAKSSDVTLPQLQRYFPTKSSIVVRFMDWIDGDMLDRGKVEGETARERLFEVIMHRFDVLSGNRDGVKAIARGLPCDPTTCIAVLWAMRRSMAWMLEAAGIGGGGIRGDIRIEGLGLVYMAAFRVWLRDDSDDMAKTMAELDRQLGRAEAFAKCLPKTCSPREFCRRSGETTEAA